MRGYDYEGLRQRNFVIETQKQPFRLEIFVHSGASASSTHLQRLVNFVYASAVISNESNDFNYKKM